MGKNQQNGSQALDSMKVNSLAGRKEKSVKEESQTKFDMRNNESRSRPFSKPNQILNNNHQKSNTGEPKTRRQKKNEKQEITEHSSTRKKTISTKGVNQSTNLSKPILNKQDEETHGQTMD